MKPILFNTEMVRAILDGRKTETRRIADIDTKITCNDGTANHDFALDNFVGGRPTGFVCRKCGFGVAPPRSRVPCGTSLFQPRYWPGDILYVRETWQFAYDADGNDQLIEGTGRYLYAADGWTPFNDWIMPDGTHRDVMPWRPSIHMPKEAARTFLLVTDVRAERLHDITIEGIQNEGIRLMPREEECKCAWETPGCREEPCGNRDAYLPSIYISKFAHLWDRTIKDDRYLTDSWEANPWVWAYKFERCEKPVEVL